MTEKVVPFEHPIYWSDTPRRSDGKKPDNHTVFNILVAQSGETAPESFDEEAALAWKMAAAGLVCGYFRSRVWQDGINLKQEFVTSLNPHLSRLPSDITQAFVGPAAVYHEETMTVFSSTPTTSYHGLWVPQQVSVLPGNFDLIHDRAAKT